MILSLASLCAQAMQRALLYEGEQHARAQAEAANRRVAYQAEASKILGSSLDYETTLKNIAYLAVPKIADWCRIDVVDEHDSVKLVSVAHIDPQKVAWVYSLQDRYPPDPNSQYGVHQVIRTGQPEFIPEIPDALLVTAARDEEQLRISRELGFRSVMIVPLAVRGKCMGAMTFVTAESGRLFTQDDLALAQEVAQRGAAAIDNARLYRQARELAIMEERQRLARDLHDSVTQALFSATLVAESIPRLWERDPERAVQRFEQVVILNRAAMADMRTLLLELRPDTIMRIRLSELLRQLVESMKGRKRVEVEYEVREDSRPLPPEVHLALYRIAQEGLSNILKHSQATQVVLHLEQQPEQAFLSLTDNGRGFDGSQTADGVGFGIMRERAKEIGAALQISSQPERGTTIQVEWKQAAETKADSEAI
jgi:signal transduction histidine kinase